MDEEKVERIIYNLIDLFTCCIEIREYIYVPRRMHVRDFLVKFDELYLYKE
ncbi:MAG: hypothetical protein ACTSRA_00030 [Promethearchaeota archaeon]